MREVTIHTIPLIYDRTFSKYGKIITEIKTNALLNIFDSISVPESGNVYQASVVKLEQMPAAKKIANQIFGDMPIEIGFCNGRKSSLNALEYHKSPEFILAATDLVLILGAFEHINNIQWFNTSAVECFMLPQGTCVELYPQVLHFAPCSILDTGFKSMIVLPKGTNEDLEERVAYKNDEDTTITTNKFLFKRNKWLLAHKEATWLIEQGAHIGLKGPNLEIIR